MYAPPWLDSFTGVPVADRFELLDFFSSPSFCFRFFRFSLGRSHSHRGMKDSIYSKKRPIKSVQVQEVLNYMLGTNHADICEKLGEYPNSRAGHHKCDDIEYEADDCNCNKKADESQDTDAEIPDAQSQSCRPEGEHDCSEHDCDHGDSSEVSCEL